MYIFKHAFVYITYMSIYFIYVYVLSIICKKMTICSLAFSHWLPVGPKVDQWILPIGIKILLF